MLDGWCFGEVKWRSELRRYCLCNRRYCSISCLQKFNTVLTAESCRKNKHFSFLFIYFFQLYFGQNARYCNDDVLFCGYGTFGYCSHMLLSTVASVSEKSSARRLRPWRLNLDGLQLTWRKNSQNLHRCNILYTSHSLQCFAYTIVR